MTDAALQTTLHARRTEAEATPAQPNRLARGGVIDRTESIHFVWENRILPGHPGDTLASALLANGVTTVGRGFKYHRSRGVMSAGVEEGGAIVSVGAGERRRPNINAATEELVDGLIAFGQNAWPSVAWDAGRVNDLLGRFLSAGFYYKTFFSFHPWTPKGTAHWMAFERLIRKAAGMGTALRSPDPEVYETAHAHCDVLVVGSGPAGLEAARIAAEAGLDVLLVEQDFALGGRSLTEAALIEGRAPAAWRQERLAALNAVGARVMPRTTVFGLYDGGVAGMLERCGAAPLYQQKPLERCWTVRAEKIVLATGAIERSLAFGDNDKPGVMTAGAVQAYVNRFGVAPGRRITLATTNDSGLAAARDLHAAGLDVAVLDARAGHAPLRALGARRVTGLETARETDAGWRAHDRLDCDLIAVAGGWSPVVNLLSHRGVKPVWDAVHARFLSGATAEPIEICGAAAGVWDGAACAASGRNAAVRLLGRAEERLPSPVERKPIRPLYEVRVPGRKLKSFIDPQHDVTTDDVRLAEREGYVSVEHLKRYTTLGMATDQGKNGNVLGLAAMAAAQGREIADIGVTTFRPPYTPVSIGALAGRARGKHFKPERRTPMHDWHLSQGAAMTDAGLWRRPWYYPQAGESLEDAYLREAAAVRETVGMCDVSTLGKIAVQGPDAAEFLNRVYVNGFAKLPIGKARYGVMLRDDGIVFDDGTTWRLGQHDYFMTTTTAGAGAVMSWLEELLQVRWPDLRVAVESVTDRWAGFAVAGPQARNVLRAIAEGVDFDDAAFPFMGVREGRLGRAPDDAAWRIARLSFSGELAYEIFVVADYGAALAEALWDAVRAAGGVCYGMEALGALRIEKGHVAGPEIDGRTTLADLGLGAMASTQKPFIGAALAKRPATASPRRQTLVGLVPTDRGARFSAGAILCVAGKTSGRTSDHGVGWVSSVTQSPALGHWIGLGFIEGGLEGWKGRAVVAADPVRGAETPVAIVSPHFLDPSGARMRPAADPPAPEQLRPAPRALQRRPALASVDGAAGSSVSLIEAAPRSVWRLTAWPERQSAAETLLRALTGANAPAPGRFEIGAGGVEALRMGPLAWKIVGLALDAAARLAAVDTDIGAALDLSGSETALQIDGPRAAMLLNRFLPIDLRDQRFPVGAVATTGMHHVPVTLQRTAASAYVLWVPRSYVASLWDLLMETAGSVSPHFSSQ